MHGFLLTEGKFRALLYRITAYYYNIINMLYFMSRVYLGAAGPVIELRQAENDPKCTLAGLAISAGIFMQSLSEKGHAADKLLEFAVMSIVRQNCKRPLSVLLAIIFLAAQTGALAHAYEHGPGSPQAQVCSTCIAGHSLSSACVASTAHIDFQQCNAGVSIERTPVPNTIHLPLARQRAPPTPL